MTTVTRAVTAEELLRFADDSFRYELVKGEIRKMSPAGSEHGKIAMRLGARLELYVEANNLGQVFAAETGFRISSNPDTVRAPDVAFVSRERIEKTGTPEGYFPGAPDLAIEVVSPSDAYAEVEEKVGDWLDAGAKMVVVVNPGKRSISIHLPSGITLLKESDTLNGGEVVPGWSVSVKELFV